MKTEAKEITPEMVGALLPVILGSCRVVKSVIEGEEFADVNGFPIAVFPSFTLKGAGSGIAYDQLGLDGALEDALKLSPIGEAAIVAFAVPVMEGRMSRRAIWNKDNSFKVAADFILDCMEEALGISHPNGRTKCHAAIVETMEFFATPKNGPDGKSAVERECYGEPS